MSLDVTGDEDDGAVVDTDGFGVRVSGEAFFALPLQPHSKAPAATSAAACLRITA